MDGAAPIYYATRFRPDQVEDAARNIEASVYAALPELRIAAPHDGVAVVVGGAPSARNYVEDIRAHKSAGHRIYAVNDMHDWLIGLGIIPDGFVFHEIMAMPIQVFAKPHPDVTYYVASWCDSLVRKELEGHKVLLWHGAVNKNEPRHEDAMKCYPDSFRVAGGYATLHRTLNIAMVEGYRDFDVYGFDCSHEKGGETHATGRQHPADEIEVVAQAAKPDGTVTECRFWSRGPLVRQADEFKRHCLHHHHLFKMRVHGDGLVTWMHRTMFPAQYEVPNG